MSELASALRAWATSLGVIAPELIEPLVMASHELHGMLGPLRPRATRRGGEPNGFKGLARRGPYDRLLLSEWAMLDELPDEFLRRAIASEHAFYDLDHQEPARSLHVRVVLDAGPTQLGIPRLGQLAALLLLVRRAQLAHATLRWSVAQAPDVSWDTLDRASIGGMLEARSLAPFVLPDLSAEPTPDELWVIGPPPSPAWSHARVLTLVERISHDEDALEASTLDARGARHTRILKLPPPVVRRRLITHPFVGASAGVHHPPMTAASDRDVAWTTWSAGAGPPKGVRFVPNAQKLELFYERGVELVNLSKLPKAKAGRLQVRDPTRAIATGYHNGHPVFIQRSDVSGHLIVEGFRTPPMWISASTRRPLHHEMALGRGLFFGLHHEGWVVDARGRLFRIPAEGPLEVAFDGVTVLDALVSGDHVRLLLRLLSTVRLVAPVPAHSLRELTHFLSMPTYVVGEADEAFFSLPAGSQGYVVVRRGGSWTALPLTQHPVPRAGAPPRVDLTRETDPSTTVLGLRADTKPRAVLWEIGTPRVMTDGERPFELPRTPIAPKLSLNGRYLAFHTAPNDANLPSGSFELWDLETRAPCLLRKEAAPWKR